jgi:hypothetical protein
MLTFMFYMGVFGIIFAIAGVIVEIIDLFNW